MMSGPFDFMFDFDGDGELNPAEEAMLIDSLNEMEKEDSSEEYLEDDDFEDKEERRLRRMYPELDFEELEFMDEDERREAIEEAGYDPDDVEFEYDFD